MPEDKVVAAEYLGWLLAVSLLKALTVVTGAGPSAAPVPAVSLSTDAIAVFTGVEAVVGQAGKVRVEMAD